MIVTSFGRTYTAMRWMMSLLDSYVKGSLVQCDELMDWLLVIKCQILMFMTYLLPVDSVSVRCVFVNILTSVYQIGCQSSGCLGLVMEMNVLMHFIAVQLILENLFIIHCYRFLTIMQLLFLTDQNKDQFIIFYPLVNSYKGRDYSFLKIVFVMDVIY